MSINSYLPLQTALQAGSFIALALAIVFLVAAIAGWRGPKRRGCGIATTKVVITLRVMSVVTRSVTAILGVF